MVIIVQVEKHYKIVTYFMMYFCMYIMYIIYKYSGPSFLWSYGSWIYNYLCIHCLSPLKLWVVLDMTLCDKVCLWHVTGRWFFPGTLVSSTNNIDCHNITEILFHNPNANQIKHSLKLGDTEFQKHLVQPHFEKSVVTFLFWFLLIEQIWQFLIKKIV